MIKKKRNAGVLKQEARKPGKCVNSQSENTLTAEIAKSAETNPLLFEFFVFFAVKSIFSRLRHTESLWFMTGTFGLFHIWRFKDARLPHGFLASCLNCLVDTEVRGFCRPHRHKRLLRAPPACVLLAHMRLLTCAFLCVLASLVSGCRKRETPIEEGIRTQTLLVGNAAEPGDLDPHLASILNDQIV